MIELFPDQEDLMDRVRDEMRASKTVLVQAATGSGKTILGAAMINGTRAKGISSIFMVPRRPLLNQSALSFEEYRIPHSFIAAKRPYNSFAQSFIATMGTLHRKVKANKAPLVKVLFVDEAHFGGRELDEIVDYYTQAGSWVIGLSATPERLDGKGLGRHYRRMVCGPSIKWLIENRRLSDYRLFAASTPDLSALRIRDGDFVTKDLASYMEQNSVLIGSAVKQYRKHADGRLNIAYCTSRKHSELVAESFRNAGIPAAHVDGETDENEMKRIIRAFAKRELKVLTNCELLTFGFDLKAASGIDVTVEAMSDLRPTESLALQMQKWGRVLRRKAQPAIILDHANNAMYPSGKLHHGFPDDERHWTLKGREEREATEGGRGGSLKHCEACLYCYRPAPVCPNCGHVHEVDSRIIREVEGELSEVSREERRALTNEELLKRDELISELTQRGIKKGLPPMAARRWAHKRAAEWEAQRVTQQ